MDSFKGPCPHRSVPVEMDESMTSSSLDLVWPAACEQCSGHTETRPRGHDREPPGRTRTDGQRGSPESRYQYQSRDRDAQAAHQIHPGQIKPPHPASVWPRGPREVELHDWDFNIREPHSRGIAGPSDWPQDGSVEDAECLETPLPLMSDINCPYNGPKPKQGNQSRYCACCPPTDKRRLKYNYGYHNKYQYSEQSQQDPRHNQHSWNPPQNRPQLQDPPYAAQGSGPAQRPLEGVVHEISIDYSHRPHSGPVTREIKKTISLPEESRNVFITYSVDTAKEIILFTKFLTDQGFKPAIDIFDNPIRRMGITKWMDRFLNDKSVLIIVVISPKYKEDVEGDGDDDHGLHTKYIHNQIQNEFIQQGCRNFRLVPVLFPNATKKHVPNWLLSTRIYHWPQDTQDLLLRLLREERYIIPTHESDLTLTVRPL